jgi:hypothetical protein
LAESIARPYRLLDPGIFEEPQEDDEDQDESMIRRVLEAPGIPEALEFVAEHRHYDCPEYDGCLRMAGILDWFFFTCRGCKFFRKK